MPILPSKTPVPTGDDPRSRQIRETLSTYAAPPAPLTPAERLEFRERLARILSEEKVDAMLIEPGGTLEYLTGVALGRSERLLAAAVMADGCNRNSVRGSYACCIHHIYRIHLHA